MSFPLVATPFGDLAGVGSTITAAFMNGVRTQFPNAIDGAGGGTYGPTAYINLTGAFGLKADRLALNGAGVLTLPATSVTTLGGTLNVTSSGIIDVLSSGQLKVENGGTIEVKASGLLKIDASGTLEHNGVFTAKTGATGDWEAGSTFSVHGLANFFGTTTVPVGGHLILVGDSDVGSGGSVSNLTVNTNSFFHVYGIAGIRNGGNLNIQDGGVMTVQTAGANPAGILDVYGQLKIRASGTQTVFAGGHIVAGAVDISLDTVAMNAGATMTFTSGTLILNSASTLSVLGNLNLGALSTITYSGGAAVSGTIADASTTTRTNPTKFSGNNAYRGERFVTAVAGTVNVFASRGDVIIPSAVLAGNIVWTLQDPPDTSFQCRARISVPTAYFATHTITVTDTSASFSIVLSAGASTKVVFIDLIFSGPGVWFLDGGGFV